MTMSLLYMNNRYFLAYKTYTQKNNKGKITKKEEEVIAENSTERSNTNNIYQNISKKTQL